MTGVQITPEASAAIKDLAAGRDLKEVALKVFQEPGAITPEVRAKLLELLNLKELPTLTATRTEYQDSRNGFGPHKAIDLAVSNAAQLTGRELLTNILGKADADILIADMGTEVDIDQRLPASFKVALFLDSNSKARNRDYALAGAITTQEEDFSGAGLLFAKKVESAIASALVLRKARDLGVEKLSPEEGDVLATLKSGFIRFSGSGALYVRDSGRLRADFFYVYEEDSCWAFGGPSLAE